MKIASSSVTMAGSSRSEKSAKISQSLVMVNGRNNAQASPAERDTVRISAAQLKASQNLSGAQETDDTVYEISEEDQRKIELIEAFIRGITGREDFKITVPDRVTARSGASSGAGASASTQGGGNSGWGMIYNKTVTVSQSEAMAFEATATITTEDGRTIVSAISLALSRSTSATASTTLRFGSAQAVDPLAVNYNAQSATLSQTKFTFDLDGNGTTEEISFVGPGSGLLALDKNRDGRINDGSELFGPASGDGFADLTAYDDDGNGWIDENDAIFDRLQIWVKDENGQDRLFALADKGIGAIYLGNVSTPFSLESAGSIQATIRKTGIFARENGSIGTMQHVDMVV